MRDDLLDSGRIKQAFHFPDVTSQGFHGDPTLASREKREKFPGLIVDEVARFLIDFNQWDLKNLPWGFDTN